MGSDKLAASPLLPQRGDPHGRGNLYVRTFVVKRNAFVAVATCVMKPLSHGRLLLLGRLLLVKGYHDDRLFGTLTTSVDENCSLVQPLLDAPDDVFSNSVMKSNMKINPISDKFAADVKSDKRMDPATGLDDKDTDLHRIPHLNIVLLV